MAIDSKYGEIPLPKIGEEEPVFVFRAQDEVSLRVLRSYRQYCEEAGSPKRHLDSIDLSIARFEQWQRENFTQVPQSEGFQPKT